VVTQAKQASPPKIGQSKFDQSEMGLPKIVIGIGSNIEAEKNIKQVKQALLDSFPSIVFSSLFKCEAIGFCGDDFINLVAYFDLSDVLDNDGKVIFDSINRSLLNVKTLHKLVSLLSQQLKTIEHKLGRKVGLQKFSDRSMDIDILLVGDSCISTPIKLPRGEILHNAYVLWPLAELLPQMKHPQKGQTFAQLWQLFDHAKQKIQPFKPLVMKKGGSL